MTEVLVSFAGRHWVVPPGRQLTFGRGKDRDVRLAHEPLDDYVSRQAGTLGVSDDAVLVRNDSTTRALLLCVPGSEREIEPAEAVTLPRHRDFSVVVVGGFGTRYELRVDAGRLPPPERPAERTELQDPVVTVSAGSVRLTAAQQRVLAALCEPMLRPPGHHAAPATYRQIGIRLGRQPGYVRNVLKQLRESLSGAGVPGLLTEDLVADAAHDFRRPLAVWAIRNGLVHPADLDRDVAGG